MLQAERNEYNDCLRAISDSSSGVELADDATMLMIAQMKHQSMSKTDSEDYFCESLGLDNDMFEELQSMVLGRMYGERCTEDSMREIGEFVCRMTAEYVRKTCQDDLEGLDVIEPDLYDDTAACTEHMDRLRLAE